MNTAERLHSQMVCANSAQSPVLLYRIFSLAAKENRNNNKKWISRWDYVLAITGSNDIFINLINMEKAVQL